VNANPTVATVMMSSHCLILVIRIPA